MFFLSSRISPHNNRHPVIIGEVALKTPTESKELFFTHPSIHRVRQLFTALEARQTGRQGSQAVKGERTFQTVEEEDSKDEDCKDEPGNKNKTRLKSEGDEEPERYVRDG